MKKSIMILCAMLLVLGVGGMANATLIVSLAGDKDSFGTGKPLGSSILYNTEPSWDPSDGDFDRELRSSYHWTHTYLLPSDEIVVGASLTVVALDIDDGSGSDPQYYDVRLYLDNMEVPGAFDDVTDMQVGGDSYLPTEAIFTLDPPFLSALQDGILNVMVDPLGGVGGLDGLMIDYAELQIETAPVPEPVAVDIKPGSCPNPLSVKSKGVLPVAILGTPDFDVSDIDVSTVLLEGVAPIRDSLEDVATPFNGVSHATCLDCTNAGPDGFKDLVLHFDTQQIVAAVGPVSDGECLPLQLTGELSDGTPFEGMDYIVVRSKGGAGPNEKPDECYGCVPKTGQTSSYVTGDDGDLQKGTAWPEPRFIDNGDGTVTDRLTCLIWVKDGAIISGGTHDWYGALTFCNTLNFAGHQDWRMPNAREMLSLIDYEMYGPALPADNPFQNVSIHRYWTSTTDNENDDDAFAVYIRYGNIWQNLKSDSSLLVLPVRGGN